MKREKPINADLPEAPPTPEKKPAPKPKPRPEPQPKLEPKPTPKPAPEPDSTGAVELSRDMRGKAQQRSAEAPTPAPPAAPSPPPPPPTRARRRQPKPLTPKLLAALVALAIVFIVAAVLGGTGGSEEKTEPAAPAPAPAETAGDGGSGAAESLGFPVFATNNTTRIGGADAATIAAAAALAVYPSRTDSQRPAAVTLVGEEDWAGAVAGAVLMAEPVRAPLLVSGRELPEVTDEAIAALGPTGLPSGPQAIQIGAIAVPGETKTTGVGSRSAAEEAAEIAALRDRLFGSPPKHVVIAPSSFPELAAPAAAWAARSGDPVLYADRDDLPAATATALRRHPDVPVYVLGPESAISADVLAGIRQISGDVKRVAGDEPVANALALARFGDGGFGWNVNDPGHGFVLARAEAPLAAAAASALSGSGTWGPLLLTDSATKLPAELRSYLLDVKPGYTNNPTRAFYNHVWVIGDQEAIDVNQQAEVNELAELAKIGGGE